MRPNPAAPQLGPAPEVTDGLTRLSQYIIDNSFVCAVVICGHPSREKALFTTQLAEFTGATVLGKASTAADRGASSPLARVVDLGRANPGVYPTLMATGLRLARHWPVVIDAPCFSDIRAAIRQHISLAEHLQQCTHEDIPIATAWVNSIRRPHVTQLRSDQARAVVDLIVCAYRDHPSPQLWPTAGL